MSILTGPAITKLVARGVVRRTGRPEQLELFERTLPEELVDARLSIDPFDPKCVGPNSYDVHLGEILSYYDLRGGSVVIDPRNPPPTRTILLGGGIGHELKPGVLYLGSTVERTETEGIVPYLDGRSSVGRMGIQIHMTAGRGDDGFKGHWTMEITCVHPVRVYAGMRIGQLTFHTIVGPRAPYKGRYQEQAAAPVPSKFHEPDKEPSK